MGTVLLQDKHPVAFFSKVLGPRARLKLVYEKELMTIVLAVQKWRHYLLGRRFIIRTDHQSLKYLMDQRIVGAEYHKWLSKIMGYNFEIQYKPGCSNKAADALSREYEGVAQLCSIVSTCGIWWDSIKEEVEKDAFIQQLKLSLQAGDRVPNGYALEHGILKYKGRLVIPKHCSLVRTLLSEYHDSPVGGHW